MIRAEDLAERLNLKRHSTSWRGRCPNCNYDRTFAMRVGRNQRIRLFCANCNDQDGIREAVGRVAGGDFKSAPSPADADVSAARQRKQEAALRLWRGSEPAIATPASRYLAGRGIADLVGSPALRFRPDCGHPEGGRLPAMIALVRNAAGEPIAVHRTYLRQDGSAKADIDPNKASLGPVWGGAVRLREYVPTQALVIGEGVESSAAAGLLMGLPAWAAVSAGNLGSGVVLPPEVREIIIAADPDPPGEAAAREAALRWNREGRRVRIARPTGPGDFADLLLAGAPHAS